MEKYQWLEEYCLAKKGVVKEFKVEWGVFRYLVGDKMFVLLGQDSQKRNLITLKNDPIFGQIIRSEYKDIIPGYHMNKEHWSSILIEGNVPDHIVKQMLDMSYLLVFNGLTKKKQKEIG